MPWAWGLAKGSALRCPPQTPLIPSLGAERGVNPEGPSLLSDPQPVLGQLLQPRGTQPQLALLCSWLSCSQHGGVPRLLWHPPAGTGLSCLQFAPTSHAKPLPSAWGTVLLGKGREPTAQSPPCPPILPCAKPPSGHVVGMPVGLEAMAQWQRRLAGPEALVPCRSVSGCLLCLWAGASVRTSTRM